MTGSYYCLRLEIPGLPKRMNESLRGSWRAKYGEAQKWKRLVALVVGSRKPPEPLEKAQLVLTRFSSTEPDFDGLVSSFKHPIDGLVECGVLAGDKISNIGQPEYRWERAPRNKGKIQIVVRGEY